MALADQITELCTRSHDSLALLRNYYEHTRHVWRLTQQLIDGGTLVQFRNWNDVKDTVVIEPPEIHALAQTYVTGYLAESVFEKSIAVLEDFIFDLVHIWLADLPDRIPRKARQITYDDVIKARLTDGVDELAGQITTRYCPCGTCVAPGQRLPSGPGPSGPSPAGRMP